MLNYTTKSPSKGGYALIIKYFKPIKVYCPKKREDVKVWKIDREETEGFLSKYNAERRVFELNEKFDGTDKIKVETEILNLNTPTKKIFE